jgi:anaerobic selenocysteine-containing dehydrogenase
MKLNRRDFMQAAAASAGAFAALVGAVRSFIPQAKAGDQLKAGAGGFDKLEVIDGNLHRYPPPNRWNSWKELSGDDWKRGGIGRADIKVHDHIIVPTICSNCEAVCGLTAWIDKETLTVRKYMGNPLHTGSKGRNCAKGIAVTTQTYDPDRIPFPLKRAPGSKRGDGKWVRVSWDDALAEIGAKMRSAISAGDTWSKKAVMHHVGRPNESGFASRVWASLGQDCTNSHTNICSSGGRFGSLAWTNDDRSSPDWENARLVMLISSHAADAGHYFQQAAGQIAAARKRGAKLVVLDPRMSNSAGMADLWIPCWPGSESAIHLAMVAQLIHDGRYAEEFVEEWWNWQEFLADTEELEFLKSKGVLSKMPEGNTFEDFQKVLEDIYGGYSMEWAAEEARVDVAKLHQLYQMILDAGDRISSFYWRATAAGNRGGWMSSSRTGLMLLSITGNFGGIGAMGVHHGRYISVAGKGHAATAGGKPPHVDEWNELSYPPEWPLASYEPSYLLPHLLSDKEWQEKWRAKGLTVPNKLAVWIPRMYNPVWINPDGFRWIEVLRNEEIMELTFNPSPVWSETNWFMDYILPVGLSGERHDQHAEPTNVEAWTGFRQPVLRVALEKMGWEPKDPARATLEAHMKAGLGEIWEESELWINLLFHHVDPDGTLGIRKFWESKDNPGKPITIPEYFNEAFALVPGLLAEGKKMAAEKAKTASTDLEKKLAAVAVKYPAYDLMRDRGAWTEKTHVYEQHKHHLHVDHHSDTVEVPSPQFWGGKVKYNAADVQKDDSTNVLFVNTNEGRVNIGVTDKKGNWHEGFATPSRKLEFYCKWMKDWGWPEYAIPIFPKTKEQRKEMVHIVSHVHHDFMTEDNAFALNPIFRLSYNIHTRSANSKWLMEISQNHAPLWLNPRDAQKLGVKRGDPVKVRVVDTVSGKESGYFVAQAQPTEGHMPGVVSCSHHAGRWRLVQEVNVEGSELPLHIMRVGAPQAKIDESGTERKLSYVKGIEAFQPGTTKEFGANGWPYAEFNKDLDNISWDGMSGVWQNATHFPHPDPLSGMHCWHQKVLLEKAGPNDKVGDLKVDIQATFDTYKAWRDELTRPAPGPGGLRRPEHLKRPWVPITRGAYKMGGNS